MRAVRGQRLSPLLLLSVTLFLPNSAAFNIHASWRASFAGRCRAQGVSRVTITPRQVLLMSSSTSAASEEAQALKQKIIAEAAGTSNGLTATEEQRDAISKAVNGLVTLNPTNDVTTSELATGMWNLVYTTTTGASGGKLGPFVGEVKQEVDIAGGLYINYVTVGPLTGKLDATWEVVNKQQWKVIFKTIAFSLWGTQLAKRQLGQEGLWTLTYLDDDMRILTARSLERETGNLYVLARA